MKIHVLREKFFIRTDSNDEAKSRPPKISVNMPKSTTSDIT